MKENYDNVNESVEVINKTGCYTTQGQQWSCNNDQTIQSESMKEGVEFIVYIQNSLLQKSRKISQGQQLRYNDELISKLI